MEAPDKGAVDKLRAYIERHENINDVIADDLADRRELRKQMKDEGYDMPTVDALLKRRKLSPDEVMTADGLLETYEQALGCGAAAVGTLESKRGADGTFHVSIAAPEVAAKKLSKATQARRSAMALAAAAAMAREA